MNIGILQKIFPRVLVFLKLKFKNTRVKKKTKNIRNIFNSIIPQMSLFLFAIFQLALGSPGAPNGPNVPLQLTGVRRGLDHVQKLPSEAFSFKLFGKNLAEDGYYFTTATRCEVRLPDEMPT